jgi:primosomal protein N''
MKRLAQAGSKSRQLNCRWLRADNLMAALALLAAPLVKKSTRQWSHGPDQPAGWGEPDG